MEIGTTQELREMYSKNFEIYLQTTSKKYQGFIDALKKRKQFFSKVTEEDGELVINTPTPESILPALVTTLQRHKGDIESLHVMRPSLGRVFELVVKK